MVKITLTICNKYNDEDYISLEVAKLQNTDNFGHDYTVYVNRLEEEQVSEPATAPKKQTKKSKAAKQETPEVPF